MQKNERQPLATVLARLAGASAAILVLEGSWTIDASAASLVIVDDVSDQVLIENARPCFVNQAALSMASTSNGLLISRNGIGTTNVSRSLALSKAIASALGGGQ